MRRIGSTSAGPSPYCFRTIALLLKQVPTLGMDVEASGPSEFEVAYANDKSRPHLLWEHEVVGSSPAAPTNGWTSGQI